MIRCRTRVRRHLRRLRCFALGCLWLAVALSAARPRSLAEAPDAARDASARLLFEEGVACVERGEWPQAEDRFRRAYALRPSPVIAYNLAATLAERRKLVESSELLRRLQLEPLLEPSLRHSAEELKAEVDARIARIRVRAPGSQPADVVRVDAIVLHPAQLGVAIPIDPGWHRVSLSREGAAVDARSVEISEGTTYDVTLTVAPFAPSPAQAARAGGSPPPSPAPSTSPLDAAHAGRDDGSDLTQTWWFWTGVGALGAAAIAIVAIVAVTGEPEPAPAYQGEFDPPSLRLEVAP